MNFLIIVNKSNVNVCDLERLKKLGYILIYVNGNHPNWEGYHYTLYIENLIGVKSIRSALMRFGQSRLLGYYMVSFHDILEIDHVISDDQDNIVIYLEKLRESINNIERKSIEHWN